MHHIFVSPSGVRSIWLRNDLASSKQRLAALEKLVAEQGILLTDAQVAALERKAAQLLFCKSPQGIPSGYSHQSFRLR